MKEQKMHFQSVFVFLVLSVVGAQLCDETLEYEKDNECCKKCDPGTRMNQGSSCKDPVCEPCKEGEYQDAYTKDSQCKRQPICDSNLNLQQPTQSKKELSECECVPDHHCADTECVSCVKNTVCKPGEKISKSATRNTDTVCEPCANGTFSNHESALTCTPLTICNSEFKEVASGSLISDRTCEKVKGNVTAIALGVIVPLVLLLVLAVVGYFFYRKGKIETLSLVEELQGCPTWCIKNTHQAVQIDTEVEQPVQHINQPQEDTEDLLKLDIPLTPGVSENGMPVIQDHSKSSLLSQTETGPEEFSDDL
ncbi:tumor necrosis factor receptor superfamily member 5 [Clarias gariepinus]